MYVLYVTLYCMYNVCNISVLQLAEQHGVALCIVALCMHHYVLYHLSIYNALQLAEQHGVQFFETSAWANEHVKEPFEALASQILEDVRAFITVLYESNFEYVTV